MSTVVKQRPNLTSAAAAAAHLFSPIPACFRRSKQPFLDDNTKDAPSTTSTSVYTTNSGSACVLTWTRTLLGRIVHIQFQDPRCCVDHKLHIRTTPFLFWRNHGSKWVQVQKVQIFWDFRRCVFETETEPASGFYVAVVVDGELVVLIGDLVKSAFSRLKLAFAKKGQMKQKLVMRREHVSGTRLFKAVAVVGEGRKVEILIEHLYSGLRFSFNGLMVLEVEHVVWKFRGCEQVEYEGIPVNVSWDVYNWLFSNSAEKKKNKKSKDANEINTGVFVFDFEDVGLEEVEKVDVWERTRIRNEMSLSSISSSSSSWGSSSSVMDWCSVEEKEMECGGRGFSLVVYATKS